MSHDLHYKAKYLGVDYSKSSQISPPFLGDELKVNRFSSFNLAEFMLHYHMKQFVRKNYFKKLRFNFSKCDCKAMHERGVKTIRKEQI